MSREYLTRRLADQEIDMEQVMRAIQVSFWCIQEQPSHRPMMGKVVQMLEGIIEIEKPPAPNAGSEVSVNGTSINVSNNVSALFHHCSFSPNYLFLFISPSNRSFTSCFWEEFREGLIIPSTTIPRGPESILVACLYFSSQTAFEFSIFSSGFDHRKA
jgi:hypothetical protein